MTEAAQRRAARLGETVEVAVGEEFGVQVRGIATGGAAWSVDLPNEVTLVARESERLAGFGGRPKVTYSFRCSAPGAYDVLFRRGRRWEAATKEEVVKVSCR